MNYARYIKHTTNTKRYGNVDQDIVAINRTFARQGLKVTSYNEGVTLIQYRIKLNIDSPVNKLLKMQPNLVIALNDNNVRLFQDKTDLVIEKPGAMNGCRIGDLYNNRFTTADGLTLMLGKDAQGNNLYTDLSKAPHILVAGTTGSGKTVMLQTIAASLLIKNPGMKMYIVDPKMVDYQIFGALPNVNLVTETADAIRTLEKLCQEMDARYTLFAQHGYSDITMARQGGMNIQPIVCIVDELADLMLMSKYTVEQSIVRLAQKARAAGIHLVIATQRPTADVVTGLIKANMPTRICMKVKQALDSRLILDQKGGESLIGNGDMLFQSAKMFEPIRIQGCYIDQSEMNNIAMIAYHTNIGDIAQYLKQQAA